MGGTLRFRRSLRRRDNVVVTVFPGDGRITEDYEFEQRELVRFAWGVLADFAPDEAAQAAAESGVSLDQALADRKHGLQGNRRNSSAPLKPGGDLHILLARIAERAPVSLQDLEKDCAGLKAKPRNLHRTLIEKGLVQRVSGGAQGTPSKLAPTVAGHVALEALTRAPESDEARAA